MMIGFYRAIDLRKWEPNMELKKEEIDLKFDLKSVNLQSILRTVIMTAQHDVLSKDIELLKNDRFVQRKSCLANLHPFSRH